MTEKPTYEEIEIKCKKLEKALSESEKKFKDFYENSVMGLFKAEIDGRLLMMNQRCAEIFGYKSPKQALEAIKNVSELYSRPEERLKYISDFNKQGFARDLEIECKKSNGDLFWLNVNTVKSVEKDGRIFLNSIMADITERKFAEAELKKFKTISDQANYGTAIVDFEGNFIYVNKNFAEMHGFSPEELTGKNLVIFHIHDQMGLVIRLREKLLNEGGFSFEEVWHVKKDGSTFPTIMNGFIIRKDDGSPHLIAVTAIDITHRKQAEEALKESEEKYHLIFNTAPVGIFHYDNNSVITSCNTKFVEIAGSSPEKLVGLNMLEEFKNERMLNVVRKSLSGKTSHFEGEYTSVTGGKTTHLKADYVPIIFDNNKVDGGVGVVEDITDRVFAEKALKESEKRYRLLVENSKDPFFFTTREGEFVSINQAFLDLFGYTEEEIKTLKVIDTYVNPDERRILMQEFARIKSVRDYELKLLKKNGEEMDCLLTASIRQAKDGSVEGYQGTIRDVSEKKRAEEELSRSREQLRNLSAYLQSVREQERTRIAREVHDDLGQALTAIKLDISWLKGKLSKNQKTIYKKAEKIMTLVDNAIKSVRRIISELRPGLLNDLGIAAAIEWQIKEFEARTGINVDITIDPEDLVLNDMLSTTIFRIFQETLTNITRHSQATYMTVRLKEKDGVIELIVRDNGVGITEDQINKKDSFGLLGMMERAHTVGGEIKISGTPGKGTRVVVSVPVEK